MTNSEDTTRNNHSWLLGRLKELKLNELILSLTLLCYVIGFAISSIYLGSLGILNLDIIRTKYIITGFLFIVFAGTVLYPLYGLVSLFRKNRTRSTGYLIVQSIQFSLERFSLTTLVVLALGEVSNFTNLPVGIPKVSPPSSWSDWFESESLNAFISSLDLLGRLFGVVAIIFGIVFLMVIVFNPKTGDDRKITRWEWIKEITKLSVKKFFSQGTLLLVLAIVLLGQVSSLLGFIANNQAGTDFTINEGWFRFLITSFLIYVFFAALLFVIFITPRSSHAEINHTHEHVGPLASGLVTTLFLVGIMLPIYSLGVYPSVPQQLGGGQVVLVDVSTSNSDLNLLFSNLATDVYLVDRTSDGVIFLVVDNSSQKFRTLEISKSQVNTIEYVEQTP